MEGSILAVPVTRDRPMRLHAGGALLVRPGMLFRNSLCH